MTKKSQIGLVRPDMVCQPPLVDIADIPRDVTEEDVNRFLAVTSTDLTPEQLQRVTSPPCSFPRQTSVLAIHWHPEFVPMDAIMARLDQLYPNKRKELVIPTQHNELLTLKGYSGVEVDCYSHGFNRKVQILLHFKDLDMERAHTLLAMLRHTFRYRSSQLFELLDTLHEMAFEDKRHKAAVETGADETVMTFCAIHAAKLKRLLEDRWASTPEDQIKNKLVRNYMDALRPLHGDRLIDRSHIYVKAVKMLVKETFSLKYFYRASEVIEEARFLGAGVVIPHPEQFWPILLADYNVDGYEVWNPQSFQYTEFLINVINRQNRTRAQGDRPLLVFMGDDCHMSEKVRESSGFDTEKTAREVGLQPAWDDMAICKSLIVADFSRERVIDEYAARLAGG